MLKKQAVSALVYALAVWVSVAFVGYGFALNRYDRNKMQLPNDVTTGTVTHRHSWTLGFFGPVCFDLSNIEDRAFCVVPEVLNPAQVSMHQVYSNVSPGSTVAVKAYSGYVVELTANIGTQRPVQLVSYDLGGGNGARARAQDSGGMKHILIGLLLTPIVFVTRRFLARRPSRPPARATAKA